MKTEKIKGQTELIEVYKSIEIWRVPGDREIETVQNNVPILGRMINGHSTIEAAKKFIDSLQK